MSKKKPEFVYLVFCNKEAAKLVYGVYKSKQEAVRYAVSLIRYRKDRSKNFEVDFGYYHFNPLPQRAALKHRDQQDSLEYREFTVFSACLRSGDETEYGDDGCLIQVVRHLINDTKKTYTKRKSKTIRRFFT